MNHGSLTAPSTSERTDAHRSPPRWRSGLSRNLDWLLLLALGLTIYVSRVGALTIRGEETRRVSITREMLEHHNVFVQTEQDEVFAERPPLCNWIIACGILISGSDSVVPARLFSAFATIATSLLLYAYGRSVMSRVGALAAATGYLTMGQIMQLGGMAENEAVMTLTFSAGLLLWEWGYRQRWPASRTWCLAYGCIALATLTKGLQGPVYFVGGVSLFLVLKNDVKFAATRAHVVAVCLFLLIIGLWQVPYLWYVGPHLAWETWTSEILKKTELLGPGKLVAHLATFPLVLLGGMLPWSWLLVAFADRRFRASLDPRRRSVAMFCLCAWIVAFPTVWFACGGRVRYLMPLFPMVAVLIAIVIDEACHAAKATWLGRAWNASLRLSAVAGLAVAVFATTLTVLPVSFYSAPNRFHLFVYAAAAAVGAVVLWRSCATSSERTTRVAIMSVASVLGLSYVLPYMDMKVAMSCDAASQMHAITAQLPENAEMVSLGEVDHVFRYHFKRPIHKLATHGEAPTEYFCFDDWSRAQLDLNFPWETVGEVCCDRNVDTHERYVIVGRRLPPSQARCPDEKTSWR